MIRMLLPLNQRRAVILQRTLDGHKRTRRQAAISASGLRVVVAQKAQNADDYIDCLKLRISTHQTLIASAEISMLTIVTIWAALALF
jgi:flagellar biosynthesis chaperone FliJ